MTDPIAPLRTAVTALPLPRQAALQEVLTGGIDVQLVQAIVASGLTHYRLAQQAGITPAALDRFVSGQRDLRLASAAKVATALGLELRSRKRRRAKPVEMKGALSCWEFDITPAINAATADLRTACRAAARLFNPPYCRHLGGINLPPRAGEQADWDRLRAALTAAGIEIGEELT